MLSEAWEAAEALIAEQGADRALALAWRELEHRRLRASFREGGGRGLLNFIKHFWPILEPERPLVTGWALLAMCKHLQAVTTGQITRLLINVPPGSMKSLLVNVFWPAWEWTERPSLRYVSFSYGAHLTERDNQKFLYLIKGKLPDGAPSYLDLYPGVELDDESKRKTSNKRTGWKFATSVSGIGTGERGDRVLLDDPHNVKEAESDTVRTETVRWFKEAMSNRLNDMSKSAIIVIMQRVHEDDVSGAILADKLGYVHLCIPMEFEPDRACRTAIPMPGTGVNDIPLQRVEFWRDPRRFEGECFWPERFDAAATVSIKLLGEHAFAGQYQQRPEPRGGGLIKRDYWNRVALKNNKFPKFNYVIASLDGAFTEKQENDPNGFTVWGAFTDDAGDACAMTVNAWRKHVTLHGTARDRRQGEKWAAFKGETEHLWGVVQWVAYECQRWQVDKLLIEKKANGIDVANELLRLFKWAKFVVEFVDPGKQDKVARTVRIQPVFAEGLIYTLPKDEKKWVECLVDEYAIFPRGKYDDQVDSGNQALWWLRKNGFLVMSDDRRQKMIKAEEYRRALRPLYEV